MSTSGGTRTLEIPHNDSTKEQSLPSSDSEFYKTPFSLFCKIYCCFVILFTLYYTTFHNQRSKYIFLILCLSYLTNNNEFSLRLEYCSNLYNSSFMALKNKSLEVLVLLVSCICVCVLFQYNNRKKLLECTQRIKFISHKIKTI